MNPRIDHLNIDGTTTGILRLDLPDPLSGGNKFFKMKYNLEEMKRRGLNRIITFGGAFSNHIAAVAAAGKRNRIETIGVIRGDELLPDSNELLKFAASCGMRFKFITRSDYRKRNDQQFCNGLLQEFGPAYLLPEGGSNEFAVKGCMEILSEQTAMYDEIFVPVGTGATLAGIILAAGEDQSVTGVAVLNGKDYLEAEVMKYLSGKNVRCRWSIEHEFTFGGYAAQSDVLKKFISHIGSVYDLPLDHVYSGKCFYAMHEKIKGTTFRGKKFLFVHTGGYAFESK